MRNVALDCCDVTIFLFALSKRPFSFPAGCATTRHVAAERRAGIGVPSVPNERNAHRVRMRSHFLVHRPGWERGSSALVVVGIRGDHDQLDSDCQLWPFDASPAQRTKLDPWVQRRSARFLPGNYPTTRLRPETH